MTTTIDPITALANHLSVSPDEITECRYDYYGLTVCDTPEGEYAVGTDDEADAAWNASLDSYIEDCIQPELDRLELGNLSSYIKFDESAWKRDARYDGRGHSLSSYDGNEIELDGGLYAFRIN